MPKTKISEYSTTNTDNSDIESINIAEGCAPSGINNAIRELMVHLKEFQTGSSGDPLTVAGAFVASGGTTANTMSVTGILTASGGTVLSGTNTISGSAVISGNINSSGTTNTFSGGNVLSGTNTLSGTTIISGNATISGTTNTISGAAIISGNINSSGTNTFSGSQIISGSINSSGSTNTFSGNTIFSVNSSSDAVRITQTGAGNALVVEDSTNPDSTPFVVNNAGQVLIGTSTLLTGSTGGSLSIATDGGTPNGNINARRHSNDTTGIIIGLQKSRGTQASSTIVQADDILGSISFAGYDGSAFQTAAGISSLVDGTPGANDMPTRLVFSTTADGSATQTERMRIGNDGTVGIGAANAAARNLLVSKNITGSTTSLGILNNGTIQSDVTASARYYQSSASTAAASFTLSEINHYLANQGTFGAGSSVTTQIGFIANSSLTGATNNYGFYGNIASGTGRWNFYANGTAQNYFEGTTNFKASQSSLPTYRGYIRLGAHGSQSLNTDGGIEFVATTFSNGYGYRISAPDLGGGSVPMVFENRMDSATWTERMRITAVGNVLIGGTATRGTTEGTNHLSIFNGTAPAGTLTNGVTFYSDAGEAKVMDAAGNATLLSPHDPVTNEWIYYSVHTPTGKKLRIDMEKMMRFLNDHFDLDFVHEE